MDKIDPFSSGFFPQPRRNERKVDGKKRTGKTFRTFLSSAAESQHDISGIHVELPAGADSEEEAVDRIFELGEKLKKNANRENVLDYKQAVSAFLKYVLKKNLLVEENISGSNILKRKRFTLVKVIDDKLDKLAAGVLQNQRDQLEILRKVDEIHGLLIDLIG